jgi:hypothetical protein
MLDIEMKKFEDVKSRDILEAFTKYDSIEVDGDERVVLFMRNSYLIK